MKRKTYIFDAKGKTPGRLAVKISMILQGKHKPNFVPYKDMGDTVIVKNIKELKITGGKMEQKTYYRHSGYLGKLKRIPLKRVFQEKPEEILKKAVLGMLPKNKLRKERIKRLKIERKI